MINAVNMYVLSSTECSFSNKMLCQKYYLENFIFDSVTQENSIINKCKLIDG